MGCKLKNGPTEGSSKQPTKGLLKCVGKNTTSYSETLSPTQSSKEQQRSPLEELSDVVLEHVFGFLDTKTLLLMDRVSTRCKEVASHGASYRWITLGLTTHGLLNDNVPVALFEKVCRRLRHANNVSMIPIPPDEHDEWSEDDDGGMEFAGQTVTDMPHKLSLVANLMSGVKSLQLETCCRSPVAEIISFVSNQRLTRFHHTHCGRPFLSMWMDQVLHSVSPSARTLKHLRIQHVELQQLDTATNLLQQCESLETFSWRVNATYSDVQIAEALLQCKQLRQVDMDLSDPMAHKIAGMFPLLEKCCCGLTVSDQTPNPLTQSGVSGLAKECPALHTMEWDLDYASTAPLLSHMDWNNFRALRCLHLGVGTSNLAVDDFTTMVASLQDLTSLSLQLSCIAYTPRPDLAKIIKHFRTLGKLRKLQRFILTVDFEIPVEAIEAALEGFGGTLKALEISYWSHGSLLKNETELGNILALCPSLHTIRFENVIETMPCGAAIEWVRDSQFLKAVDITYPCRWQPQWQWCWVTNDDACALCDSPKILDSVSWSKLGCGTVTVASSAEMAPCSRSSRESTPSKCIDLSSRFTTPADDVD